MLTIPDLFYLVRLKKGKVLYDLKRFSEAITAFDYAIQLNPNDSESMIDKGLCYDELERYSDAIYCFDSAIQLKPKNKYIYLYKGY